MLPRAVKAQKGVTYETVPFTGRSGERSNVPTGGSGHRFYMENASYQYGVAHFSKQKIARVHVKGYTDVSVRVTCGSVAREFTGTFDAQFDVGQVVSQIAYREMWGPANSDVFIYPQVQA